MLLFPIHYLLPTYLLLSGGEAGHAEESEINLKALDHGFEGRQGTAEEASSYQPHFGLPLASPLPPTRSVSSSKISSINLPKEAKKIASVLRKISNVEIGLTNMQAVYDEAPFRTVDPDEVAVVDNLVSKLQAKITEYKNIARTTLQRATNTSMFNTSTVFSQSLPLCQFVDPSNHKVDIKNSLYGGETVMIGTPCLVIDGSLSQLSSTTLDFIRVAAQDIVQQKQEQTLTTKWQYAFSLEFSPGSSHGAEFVILEHPGHSQHGDQDIMAFRWAAMDRHINSHKYVDDFNKKYKEYLRTNAATHFPHKFLANHISHQAGSFGTASLLHEFLISEEPWNSCHSEDCQAVVSLTWAEIRKSPSHRQPTVVNMVGMDITVDELVEDFTYSLTDLLSPDGYVFVLINDTKVLVHPRISRQGLKFPPVSLLEPNLNLTTFTSSTEAQRQYFCKLLAETPFRACISWANSKSELQTPQYALDTSSPPLTDMIYHRFDLYLLTPKQCLHETQISRADACSLYLSPAVFSSPFEHIIKPETRSTVQGYLGFLNDKTQLLVNGLFKSGTTTKAQVHLLHSICDEWLTRFHTSKIGPQILARFAVTTTGVMVSFPPSRFDVNYDPTEETWYQRAISQPGKITLTSPPVDNDDDSNVSSSPSVRFSHTIYEGKPNAMHSITNTVAAVLGLDIKAKYLHQLLLDLVPDCRVKSLRCFLMDDSGYLIVHPKISEKIMETNPVEKYHITHLESVFAREFLNEKEAIVRKKECFDVSAQTVQRFYTITAPLDGVYSSNRTIGLYSLISIAGTNVYFVVLNAEIVGNERAFCPCSLTDRNCLSCEKMEATACECPCECKLDYEEVKMEACPRRPVEVEEKVEVKDGAVMEKYLPKCWEFACVGKTIDVECGKSPHCEWCSGGGSERYKEEAFCSLKGKCYVYGQGDSALTSWKTEPKAENSSAVGPVVALVATISAVVLISLYCFCNHRREELNNGHLLPADLSQTPVTFIDSEDDPTTSLLRSSRTSVQAANGYINPTNGDVETEASPYAIGPGYKRPSDYVRGSNSVDNGYSTMTGQDDSETHSSYALSRPSKTLLYRLEEGHVVVGDEVLVDVSDSGKSDVESSVGGGSAVCWDKLQTRRLQKQTFSSVCQGEGDGGAIGSAGVAGRQVIVAYADVHAQ